jgi:molybdenum cofactor guanylyltransferase
VETGPEFGAIVLAGGAGRRMAGTAGLPPGGKPALRVAGRSLLARVLDAVAHASATIVVGPASLGPDLDPGVRLTLEQPVGGGPVAAIAAGLALLPDHLDTVAVLAGDLPFLDAGTVDRLRAGLGPGDDGLYLLDAGGRAQWLCGVWRAASLRARVRVLGNPAGASLAGYLGPLRAHGLGQDHGPDTVAPPWFDCDTRADLQTAEEWARGDAGRVDG